MSIVRRAIEWAHHLFALSEGRPTIGRGVRTAFALLVPVIAGDLLQQPLFAWAALGGWLGSLADKGGSYRTRAATMSALAVLGAACTFAGTEAAHSVPIAVLSMLLVGVIGGLGRVYGDEGSTIGLFIAVLFAVAVGSPSPSADAAWMRAAFFLGGVVWAMVLSLLLWPLHPFRPARRAVARVYHDLAKLARALENVSNALGDQSANAARDRARALHAEVRSALENARIVLADVRRPRFGRSTRGEQLLVLTEGAEQLFGTLVAIDAELEAAHESGSTAGDEAFARAFASVADTLDLIATAVDDTAEPRPRPRLDPGAAASLAVPTDWPNVHLRAAATLLSRLASDVRVMMDTAAHIDERASSVVPSQVAREPAVAATRDPHPWLRPLREALSLRSLPMRHALRMGIAAAVAVWLSFALDITRGYWATITALIVLQPYAGATVRRTLQRVAGSVAGGIIAAALAVVARTKLAIATVMFPLTVGAVAVLPLNYGVFVLLLTPVFVLLAEPHPGDWGIAGLRVVNTLMGGAIALVASRLLWPVHESTTYAAQLASLLRELRALLLVVTGPGEPTTPAWRRAVDEARRRFGVAATNAEATLQRIIQDDFPTAQRVEAAMTLLTYGRRMASTLSALAEARTRGEVSAPLSDASPIAAGLEALAAELVGSAAPNAPGPAATESAAAAGAGGAPSGHSLQDAQLERLRAQFAVMQRAVARYLAA